MSPVFQQNAKTLRIIVPLRWPSWVKKNYQKRYFYKKKYFYHLRIKRYSNSRWQRIFSNLKVLLWVPFRVQLCERISSDFSFILYFMKSRLRRSLGKIFWYHMRFLKLLIDLNWMIFWRWHHTIYIVSKPFNRGSQKSCFLSNYSFFPLMS